MSRQRRLTDGRARAWWSLGGYMANTFDLLRQAQKKVAARRFGGRQRSAIKTEAKEKEPRPTGNAYSRLRQLVEKEAAYAEGVLKALPHYAFERWEFQDLAQQFPEIAAPVVYAHIEEIVKLKPTMSERDLIFAIAQDLGKSPDDFAAGFERWKNVASKAQAYLDLLGQAQDSLKKEREAKRRR